MDLDEYAKAEATASARKSKLDGLSPEIQRQIIESTAPHSVVAKWLKEHHGMTIAANTLGKWRADQQEKRS